MSFFNQFVEPGSIERLEHIALSNFEVMTYTDAITALQNLTVNLNTRNLGTRFTIRT